VANNLVIEFDELRQQFGDLIAQKGDDEQLKEKLLSTCARLLSIYTNLQAKGNGEPIRKQHYSQPGTTKIAETLQLMQETQQVLRETELHYKSILDSEGLLVCQLLPD
jgi:hypothetical protein